jgi:superoxide dismutase, Cu-Zn family
MRVLHAAATLALVAIATTSILEAAPLPRAMAHRVRLATLRAELTAKLEGRDGRKVAGMATARPGADGKSTDISVTFEGDTPGATRPWHVHSGSCKQAGGVVGGARAYSPIAVDIKGQGRGTASIPLLLADTATYYVNIHDSAAAMSIIVACGDLVGG